MTAHRAISSPTARPVPGAVGEGRLIGMTLCSGIGVGELAAPWIDWRYQSEIDPFACAVLRHRFPHAENLGDMTKFQEWPNATVDVLAGGTPCQAFSVAGLRQGLADPRGNLTLTYLAIADRYRPRWVVWENVPGVLSVDGGRVFGAFLGGLAELGYGWAYRVVDAQYGRTYRHPRAVPQRRRRVFLVGHLGGWERAAAVLFEGESLRGNPPPRREAGQGTAAGTLRGTDGGSDVDHGRAGHLIPEVTSSLDASYGRLQGASGQDARHGHSLLISQAFGGNNTSGPIEVSTALNAHGGPHGRLDFESETFVLRAEGFDASEDGTGRGTPLVPVAIQERAVSENPDAGPDGAGWRQDGAAYTLEARTVPQAVAFNSREDPEVTWDRAGPLGASSPQAQAIALDPNQITSADNRSQPNGDVLHTMPAKTEPPHLATPYAVRRLTPVECEKLQGLPPGWTRRPLPRQARRGRPPLPRPRQRMGAQQRRVRVPPPPDGGGVPMTSLARRARLRAAA